MMDLPAPWADNGGLTENISVYTPPGYDPKGARRYPVLYEAPFDYPLWDSSIHFKSVLDSLIVKGTVPPMIVVFINAWRAPIYDTECANSVDGRQWMDTFISKTVVSYVDTNYRTMARADARALFGFSQGAYCAAIVALRHPTVFATAISFSGYFRAGDGDLSSKDPFGGDPAALRAASPTVVAAELPQATRAALLFIVVAKSSEPSFGALALDFEEVLATEGYKYLALDSRIGHGWDQVSRELPAALEAWAAQLVSVGAF
jgi:enterochelin esterase-like enzyme